MDQEGVDDEDGADEERVVPRRSFRVAGGAFPTAGLAELVATLSAAERPQTDPNAFRNELLEGDQSRSVVPGRRATAVILVASNQLHSFEGELIATF